MEHQRLEMFEQDAAVTVHDRFGFSGRTGGVQDPQRRVERETVEGRDGVVASGEQVLPGQDARQADGAGPFKGVRGQVGDDDGGAQAGQPLGHLGQDSERVERPPAVGVAVDADEHGRAYLGETVRKAGGPEVGGAGRPDRSDSGGGEHRHHRVNTVRQHGADPVARSHPQPAQARGGGRDLAAQFVPGHHGRGGVLAYGDHRRRRPVAGQSILGVVHLGGREPSGARHPRVGERGPVPAFALDRAEVPDRVPEAVEIVHRPLPQGGGVGQPSAPFGGQPLEVGGDPGGADPLRGRRPQQLSLDAGIRSDVRGRSVFVAVSSSHGPRP